MTDANMNERPGLEKGQAGKLEGESIGAKAVLPQITMQDLDFSNAPVVQPIGYRFIIPVPNLGAENRTIEVTNWKGEPEKIVGYEFRNGVDQSAQAVQGDGQGVIIALVNPEKVDCDAVSKAILTKIEALGGAASLNAAKLDELLNFIRDEVGITDLYNSTDKIAESMVPQSELASASDRPIGLYEKQDKAGPVAVYVDGPAQVLDGPHAGKATYDSGFLAVRIPPNKEGAEPTYRSVHPDAITSCYKLEDGTALTDPKTQIPVVQV